jgi:transcriptional regulator with XRE-family HTH domain
MKLYADNFSHVFTELLKKSGVSCYQISQFTLLDQGYLSRLKSGERTNPSVETILKIGLALTHYSDNIDLYDIHMLFKSVGRSLYPNDNY